MRVINEALLARFRQAYRCEWCRKLTLSGCDPHHIFSRGAGRLDVAINLISLCRVCHGLVHAGEITREDLLAIVATREGVSQDWIVTEIYRLRREVK